MEVHGNEILFDRLINHITLHYNSIADNSLFYGKMGGVIFFYNYARYSEKIYYSDFAEELLDSILSSVNINLPINMSTGLCGISWGIEYLISNRFIEGNSDEILQEIDNRVSEISPIRMHDFSFMEGLGGVLFYVNTRLQSVIRENNNYPFKSDFLEELAFVIRQDSDNKLNKTIKRNFELCLSRLHNYNSLISMPSILLNDLPHVLDDLNGTPIGMYKGCTGVAFQMLKS